MEWWAVLSLFLVGVIAALVSGLPIAFAFLLVDIVGVLFFMGPQGLTQITLQIFSSLSTFSLTPIPLFILMGELLFHSGMAYKTLDVTGYVAWPHPRTAQRSSRGEWNHVCGYEWLDYRQYRHAGYSAPPRDEEERIFHKHGSWPHRRSGPAGRSHPAIFLGSGTGQHRSYTRG